MINFFSVCIYNSILFKKTQIFQNSIFEVPSLNLKKKVEIFHFTSLKTIQTKVPEKNKIQIIIQHWIRILQIKFGWIHYFDKLVVNYVTFFLFLSFINYNKNKQIYLLFFIIVVNTGNYPLYVWSIDYLTFDDCQFICSGSDNQTVCVWDIDNNKQIQSFNEHSDDVYCVKFSSYHYHNHRQNVICSSSRDNTIRFWDFKHNKQLQIFNGHLV
ncbi:F-box and wd40 domain protein, partial [Reticulomyxa filosa]